MQCTSSKCNAWFVVKRPHEHITKHSYKVRLKFTLKTEFKAVFFVTVVFAIVAIVYVYMNCLRLPFIFVPKFMQTKYD